jgi:hypothetical protein
MRGPVVLAATHAAVGSGAAVSFLPALPAAAVGGFAVGTLLSSLCYLLVVIPHRRLRRSRPAADPDVDVRAESRRTVGKHAAPSPPKVASRFASTRLLSESEVAAGGSGVLAEREDAG